MKIGGLTPAESFQPGSVRMKKRDTAARMPTIDPGHVRQTNRSPHLPQFLHLQNGTSIC